MLWVLAFTKVPRDTYGPNDVDHTPAHTLWSGLVTMPIESLMHWTDVLDTAEKFAVMIIADEYAANLRYWLDHHACTTLPQRLCQKCYRSTIGITATCFGRWEPVSQARQE